MANNKINKNMVPEGFTFGLALVDALPVVFFAASFGVIAYLFGSWLFLIGAILCFLGGIGKVIWKLIVVFQHKNIWWLFVQMRFLMPLGFILMIASLAIWHSKLDFSAIWSAIISLPSLIFFIIGLVAMLMMVVFCFVLDSSDKRSNWIEQLTNAIAQASIFVGLLFLL